MMEPQHQPEKRRRRRATYMREYRANLRQNQAYNPAKVHQDNCAENKNADFSSFVTYG